MAKVKTGSSKHGVPSPCGRDDDECHRFSTNFSEPVRYLYLRFTGIHNSHYIGINRLRVFSGEKDLTFKVLMADDSQEGAAAAEAVVAPGWWAVVGKEHSLLIQLDDAEAVSHVALWCANLGATPLEIEICDGRPLFPDMCTLEETNAPSEDLHVKQADAVVHQVKSGCGKSEDECEVFEIKAGCNTHEIKHLLLQFKGIHNSHYIGVNRVRIFDKETEIKYNIVAADASREEAENIKKKCGWWAIAGKEHFLVLEFEKPTTMTSVGLWCANAGATPQELHVVTDMGWVEDLTSLLESLASDKSRSLGKNARELIERNSGLLLGLAQGNERLRWALLVKVWAGEAPTFPIRKNDALGRLQARLFCECAQGSGGSQKSKDIIGLGWQHFPAGKMPSMEETSIEVESRLLRPSEDHAPEWLGTGLYVPPGGKICVSSEGDSKGWSVRIGAHTDDISGRDDWERWPRVSSLLPLTGSSKVFMATPFGGNVYLVRCSKASEQLKATFSGNLVQQPPVSIQKGVHVDILKSPGGWVDCEGRKVILTLPVHTVRAAMDAGADIVGVLDFYDRLWACYNELSPHTDPRPQRIVPDIQTSVGYMHSGYPIMTHFDGVLDASEAQPIPKVLDLERLKKEGSWGLFHELGHNMQRKSWTFRGTVEVTVNLFTLWGTEQLCNVTDKPHRSYSTEMPSDFIAAGSPRAKWEGDPFLALRTYAQVISTFGWKALQATFKHYAEEGEVPRDYAKQVSSFVRYWSLELGRDIRPHWRHWGFEEELKDADPQLDKLEPWSFAETNA